ncbi:MAG: hypothetical protein ACQESG_04335, partial [Nanobdellota archaeon]
DSSAQNGEESSAQDQHESAAQVQEDASGQNGEESSAQVAQESSAQDHPTVDATESDQTEPGAVRVDESQPSKTGETIRRSLQERLQEKLNRGKTDDSAPMESRGASDPIESNTVTDSANEDPGGISDDSADTDSSDARDDPVVKSNPGDGGTSELSDASSGDSVHENSTGEGFDSERAATTSEVSREQTRGEQVTTDDPENHAVSYDSSSGLGNPGIDGELDIAPPQSPFDKPFFLKREFIGLLAGLVSGLVLGVLLSLFLTI